jgi:hypothetical protein
LDVADYLETAATECNKKKVDVFIEVDPVSDIYVNCRACMTRDTMPHRR